MIDECETPRKVILSVRAQKKAYLQFKSTDARAQSRWIKLKLRKEYGEK